MDVLNASIEVWTPGMEQAVNRKIEEFFDRYPDHTVTSGTVLIFADEDPNGVIKIDNGRVIEYDISDEGTRIVLNVFKAPAFLPMSWVVAHEPNIYFYEAHGVCTYRKAPSAEVLDFLKREPDVLLDLLSRLYRGVSGLQRRMIYMASNNAKKRLAYELLITAQRFCERQDNGAYEIPLSELDLAANSGLTRETVNREIAKLKQQNIVIVQNKKIYVVSLAELERHIDE